MDGMMFVGKELVSRARILILYAAPYDMLNEKQEKLQGCTVKYLLWGEYGEGVATQGNWNPAKPVGFQPGKCSISYELREKIPFAPAIYDGEFVYANGSDGKLVGRLRDVAYVGHVDMKLRHIPGISVPGMAPQPEPEPYDPVMGRCDGPAKQQAVETPSTDDAMADADTGTAASGTGTAGGTVTGDGRPAGGRGRK